MRVKEFNYFDARAVLSMKTDLLEAPVMDYESVTVGDTVFATIETVNEQTKTVSLKINDFVRGLLTIEHMADHPLKVIPPKLAQVGKQIKVRVFAIENRTLLFTKKDTLMKEKTPVYQNAAEVVQGNKVMGVVVGQVEHGFVIRTFGGIKGLLTLDEIKKSTKQRVKISDLKPGSMVKTYVLFNKKKSGLALTLDKKKAKKQNAESSDNYLDKFGPSEEDIKVILETYSTMIKESKKEEHVGQVFQFRCVENKGSYFVAKTVLAEKKNKIAILPKCLVSSFGITLPLSQPQFTFEGLVLEHVSGIPVIALKPELIHCVDQIPQTKAQIDD